MEEIEGVEAASPSRASSTRSASPGSVSSTPSR
jgi:hypothetical protein